MKKKTELEEAVEEQDSIRKGSMVREDYVTPPRSDSTRKTIMQTASGESFRLAKAILDEKIIEAVEEFKGATPDCRLKGIDIMMKGEEDGLFDETEDTIDKVRVIIEVV